MSGPRERVLVVDRLADGADPGVFMRGLVDLVNGEWAGAGVALVDAFYVDGRALLDTVPGLEPLSVDRVRAFLQAKKEQAA